MVNRQFHAIDIMTEESPSLGRVHVNALVPSVTRDRRHLSPPSAHTIAANHTRFSRPRYRRKYRRGNLSAVQQAERTARTTSTCPTLAASVREKSARNRV